MMADNFWYRILPVRAVKIAAQLVARLHTADEVSRAKFVPAADQRGFDQPASFFNFT